ncbi:MAG: IS66 family insertion sequence element accessory protein TnpB, partial [Alphaproteobacteria bacterium]|nr:IS66 family insertion sequence element accessory protein TnpB [Alphaproteobacteria bacterium]
MLSVPPSTRIFLALEPCDLRGSYRSLGGAARALGLEPSDGNLYLFMNRRRFLVKIVWFDGSGWCVLQKRLIRGSFQLPEVPPGTSTLAVDGPTLAALLQGIDLRAPRRRWF